MLLVTALASFFIGLVYKESIPLFFYSMISICALSLILAVILIALNYKKLRAYDEIIINNKKEKTKSKIKDTDFSCIECNISYDGALKNLKANGYSHTKEDLYYKKNLVYGCDFNYYDYYYVDVICAENKISIESILQKFSKGETIHNTVFIFINENNENIEYNFNVLKEYVKEAFINERVYKQNKLFAPIIIVDKKAYYIKFNAISSVYNKCIEQGLEILSCVNKK